LKVLINTPDLSILGGVANHFAGLSMHWNEKVKYNYIGTRNGISGIVLIPFDILKFVFRCQVWRPDIVLLNPSLGDRALIRDAIYLRISKGFRIKTIVFFHGWNTQLQEKIDFNPNSFIRNFSIADSIIVLASEFRRKLKFWGYRKPVFIQSTKVNDELLSNFDISNKVYNKVVFFLARIEKSKGIFTAIKAFKLAKNDVPDLKFIIAGKGEALKEAKCLVNNHNIKDVSFLGRIDGEKLSQALSSSSIYILPTVHGEGVPTSVLEAMAFGLPIITRPVGGLNDFFEEGKMGFLLESLDYKIYADTIVRLVNDQEKLLEIGLYNHSYAKNHFMSSKVANKLEKIFKIVHINAR